MTAISFAFVVVFSYVWGGMEAKDHERKQWCEHTHELHEDVKECMNNPDYRKEEK